VMLLEGSLATDAQLPCDLRPGPPPRTRGTHLRPLQLIHQLPQGGDGAQPRPGIPIPRGGGQGDGLSAHTVNLGWQPPDVNLSWQQPQTAAIAPARRVACRCRLHSRSPGARAPATHRDHSHSAQMLNYSARPHPNAAQLPRKHQLTVLSKSVPYTVCRDQL
jgi:hypothetical protein